MELVLEIAGDQIDGARDYQEDAFLITYLDDAGGESRSSALVIMADGMGGHAAGNIASNMVVSEFNKSFTGNFGKDTPPSVLRASLEKANGALKSSIKETPALDGMGCTMVTAALTKGRIYWVSVGDSHLYVIRDKELIKKNEDHSYGGYLDRMKSQGMDVEAEAGLSRNMLMSAMTGDEIPEVHCPDKPFTLLPGDRVVVASDGLDTLSTGTILQTSQWSSSAKECVRALLAAVDDAKKPRQDNTTVIVCDVAARDVPPVAPPAPRTDSKLGDTQPLDMGLLKDEMARERDSVSDDVAVESESAGRGKGAIIGAIVAVVLAAAGAGAWFFLGAKPGPAPVAVVTPPQADTASAGTDATAADGTGSGAATGTDAGADAGAPPSTDTSDTSGAASDTPTDATASAGGDAAAASAEPAEFRDALKAGGEGPLMVPIAAGTFEMGSSGLSVKADERPRHSVTVPAFALSRFEVTFQEYERFASASGRAKPDNQFLEKDTHPVFFVSWDDAYAYTQWLSSQTGQRYRLPSEAEWEYAAGAGATSPFAWGYEVEPNRAHCFDCKTGLNPRQATRVGRFEPNAFGLHDMAGNVSEWVHDCYHPNYEGAPIHGGVWEGGDCSSRVVRGGAYTNTSKSIRPAAREKYPSQQGYDSIGFRVARDL